jgi:exopolyphosphatase/guanosine-5'-triphosphate,3'-diphosphate pyrophosphatase
MYLIQNCELFGLSRKDILLVSLIARYHRRSSPKPDHQEFNVLSRSDRQAVMKTASILRTADALDRSFSQRIREISCSIDDQRFIITTHSDADLSLEQLAIKNKGPMFEDVYGLIVTLRPAK